MSRFEENWLEVSMYLGPKGRSEILVVVNVCRGDGVARLLLGQELQETWQPSGAP